MALASHLASHGSGNLKRCDSEELCNQGRSPKKICCQRGPWSLTLYRDHGGAHQPWVNFVFQVMYHMVLCLVTAIFVQQRNGGQKEIDTLRTHTTVIQSWKSTRATITGILCGNLYQQDKISHEPSTCNPGDHKLPRTIKMRTKKNSTPSCMLFLDILLDADFASSGKSCHPSSSK